MAALDFRHMPSWRDHTAERRARPPQVRGAIARPRLLAALAGARVLLVVAPAGYGKTTAFAAHLPDLGGACWLTLHPDDADPAVLAGGLALALEGLPGGAALADLMDAGAAPRVVARRATDLLVAARTLLVLDEAHVLGAPACAEVARELLSGPRVALLARTLPRLPGLAALEARGEAQRLGPADLAFDRAETGSLLTAAGVAATRLGVQRAQVLTEGWPIALRLLGQAVGQGRVRLDTLDQGSAPPLDALFEYLAQEVLGPLEPGLRDFLTRSSVFEDLTPALLQGALGEPEAGAYLDALAASGTFLTREANAYRAHGLLRAHLRAALDPAEARGIAARGARHFEAVGEARQAVAAHLAAGDDARAAALLVSHGAGWLAQGRLGLLDRLLPQLSPEAWAQHPALHALAGDVRRLQSRYPEALAAYARAPEPQALLGRARVYLDTVQPAAAAPLLAALECHPTLAAHVVPLTAENLLNAGELEAALQLAPALAGTARYALRRGDLTSALAHARAAASGERGGARAAGNHREALLLQSFVCALSGELTEAEVSARAGLAEGERLESPFVQALAHARLGHALLAAGNGGGARAAYARALDLTADLNAPRLSCEPLMGLACLDAAEGRVGAHAAQALEVGLASGDRYMTALVRLVHGLGLLWSGAEAAHELRTAHAAFTAVGDSFGTAAAALALFAVGAGEAGPAVDAVERHPVLLTHPSLFAPHRDRAARAGLLARLARAAPGERARLRAAARGLGYAEVPQQHPGEAVRVQLLGRLAVWRGGREVRDWGRARARELLALLVLAPEGHSREALIEALYPEADPQGGERNFRSVLHALGSLLEGGADAPGFFLERGDWLRLRPGPDLQVDWWDATAALNAAPGTEGRAVTLAQLPAQLAALDLPEVEEVAAWYAARLPEALSEEAALALAAAHPEVAARLAERALTAEPAFEPAARLLMRARHALADPAGAQRAFVALRSALAALGLDPLPETSALAAALRLDRPATEA